MMKTFALLLPILAAACGDNHAAGSDAHTGPDAPTAPPRAVVVAGDFTAGHPGVLSTFDPATKLVTMNAGPAMAVGDDPVLRHWDNELFVVNRADGNNVTILDATTLALKEQLGTGASSNPQDVAVAGDKLYVAAFGSKGVLVLTRGTTTRTEIDLSADDPDGKPNCNSVYLIGTDLYVSCELLDDSMQFLPPRGNGKVYVVDIASETVTQTIALQHKNPFGLLERLPDNTPHGGDLVIPTVFFDDGSGCIERVTTGAGATSAGCVVDNTDLGGYASRVDVFPDGSGGGVMFIVVPAADFMHSNLRAYDMNTNALWNGSLNPPSEVIGDLAICIAIEQVVVSDTAMGAAGLRLYQSSTELTTAAMPIGLTPSSSHGLVCY